MPVIHRIFDFILSHLAHDDLVFIQTKTVEHITAVDQHICQLFLNMFQIIICITPL